MNEKLKKIINKISILYFKCLDFVIKYKFHFIVSLISVLLFIIGFFLIKWYFALLIVLGIDALVYTLYILKKRGMFVKKKNKKIKTKSVKKKNVKKVKQKEHIGKRILRYFLIFICVCFLAGLVGVGAFFTYIVTTTEDFDANKLYRAEATILYDKDGKEFARIGAQNREKITYDELPEVLIDAIIATEDSRFFQHNGVDIPRFTKATIGQLMGRDAGGASTLTMQVSKNNFTDTIATGLQGIIRKFRDIYISMFQLEKNYTKQQIIEFYVNDSLLGASAYGVEQASQTYFGKSAKDLNLAEASLIAGLFQAPNAYNPFRNPEGATQRRAQVLYLMVKHGYITEEESKIANSISVESLLVPNDSNASDYQAFIDTVADEIYNYTLKELGTGVNIYTTPLQIYTTMDTKRQTYMNEIFSGEKFKWENEAVQAGAVVIDVDTGAIVAVGAGRNRTGVLTYNYATDIERQIGSTSKPLYDYGPGIEYNNWSTYTPFVDETHKYSSGVEMNNWDGSHMGLISLRTALIESRNVPALKAFQSIKNSNIYKFATNLGLNPELEGGETYVHEAHSIGAYNGESPLSMAGAYAAFANGGYYNSPHSFTKFIYRDTDEVVENKVTKKRAMSSQTSYMITSVLKDTASSYGYKISNVSYAAKTGTTNFPSYVFNNLKLSSNAVNDLWVAGYDADYSIAVWYGYPEMTKEYASKGYYNRFSSAQNLRLWTTIGKYMFKKGSSFSLSSSGVEKIAVEKETYPAQKPSEYTPEEFITYELFKSGTGPTSTSTRFSQLPDVTNLNVKVNNNTATLSWEAIATPKIIDEKYLKEYFEGIYKKEKDVEKYLEKRLEQNKKTIGDVIYEIYMKNEAGEFVKIGSTKDTKFDYTISGNTTFLVKTAFELFSTTYEKDNSSNGIEISTTYTPSPITSNINGGDTTVQIGANFVDSGVSVYNSGVIVNTNDYTVTKTIYKFDNLNTPITNIDTSKIGKYKIKYEIKYGSYSNILWRNVEVKEVTR